MPNRNILTVLVMALLVLVAAPVAFAQQGYSEEVFAVDQDVVDGTVRVTRATINGPGWVVIHADEDGGPGPVLGQAAIMDGVNASIVIPVDADGLTDMLYAMLHVDEGEVGQYEFPGPDAPVVVDDEIIMVSFAVTGITETTPEPTEEPAEESSEAEATPEPTEEAAEEAEATPEPTEEAAEEAEATPEPTEEAAEEAEATPEPTEEAAEEAEDAMMAADIVDTAVEAGTFETLVSAVQAAGLEDALRGEGPFTVFAPNDEAFAALPEGLLESLDNDTLAQILLYHVVPNDKLMADDISQMGSAITLEGSMLEFAVDGDTVMVNDATVIAPDVDASNGVIHVIDSVILPPAVQEALAAAAEPEEEATPEPAQSIKGSYQESDGATVTVDMVEAAADGFVAVYADDAFEPGELLGAVAVPAGVSEDVAVELDVPLAEGGMVWAVLHADEGEAGVFEPDVDPVASYNESRVQVPFNLVIAEMTAAAADEAEATPEATEEAMEESAEMAEATPEATEEAMEESAEMAEATPEATEEAMEESAEMAEATPEATEEAMEESEEMAEATPEPTEEAMEDSAEMAEATPEATEEAMEESAEMAEAPDELPETGGALAGVGGTLPTVLVVLGGLAAFAFATRRRQA